ncbi:MAG: CBS domain-containing protein [bacterium]
MKVSILKRTILKLLQKGQTKSLCELISRIHPADLALVVPSIKLKERKTLFEEVIDDKSCALILSEVSDKKLVIKILNNIDHKRISKIFHHIPTDVAASILSGLKTTDIEAILRLTEKEDATKINGLLRYEQKSSGSIMTPTFKSFHQNLDVDSAIKELRASQATSTSSYIYVTDKSGRLQGYMNLCDLLSAKENSKLSEITWVHNIYVKAHEPIEEVLRKANRYHLIEVPIISKDRMLVGVVTINNIIKIMKNNSSENMLKNVGVPYIEDPINASIWNNLKIRFWWLMFCFIGALAISFVLNKTIVDVNHITSSLFMIPVVAILSIINSIQTSTSTTRNIFLGKIDGGVKFKFLYNEIKANLFLGIFYGSASGFFSFSFYHQLKLACVTSLCIALVFPVSAILGFMFPVIMTKIKRLPAGISLPFLATISLLICAIMYLLLSTNLMAIDIIR